jgi:hypothetical protein
MKMEMKNGAESEAEKEAEKTGCRLISPSFCFHQADSGLNGKYLATKKGA